MPLFNVFKTEYQQFLLLKYYVDFLIRVRMLFILLWKVFESLHFCFSFLLHINVLSSNKLY